MRRAVTLSNLAACDMIRPGALRYWTPDRDHIDGRCGYGFVRAAPIQQEMKASQT